MTLSVGLGKIVNDPTASIRTRKALGALSTPGLLVLDKGLTINNDGRLNLRLKAGGGITEDATGLSLSFLALVKRALTATATFTLVFVNESYDYTVTVTGALAGDTVIVSPIGTPVSGVGAWSGFVSAADTVIIRVRTGVASGSSSSQQFRVAVIGF